MLKPELHIFEIGPELRDRLRPRILGALFDSVREIPSRRRTSGPPLLTVTEAKERLCEKLPVYQEHVGRELPREWRNLTVTPLDVGNTLHEWLGSAVVFFRREGAQTLRDALHDKSGEDLYEYVWNALLQRKLAALARSSGMLTNDSGLRVCDMVMECTKLWTRELCKDIDGRKPKDFSPSAYLLDVESDIEGIIKSENGEKVRLRGRPDALSFDRVTGELRLWEYKFGRQGQYELQVAQVLLYMELLEAVKGWPCKKGFLAVFRPVEDESIPDDVQRQLGIRAVSPPFPIEVENAFDGYVGNEAAVRQIKIDLTLALRETPPRMDQNIMFCGPPGLGKTELARRVARCLGTPLVDVNATTIRNLDQLVSMIDSTLESTSYRAEQVGEFSGKPLLRYPPLVLFIDEAHELRRRPDQYLNFFEPKDRRCHTSASVCDFKAATILLATTDKGKLPKPFLTRFHIIDLRDYSAEEVGGMLVNYFKSCNKKVPQPLCLGLARIGRLVPRIAIERSTDFIRKHQYSSDLYPLTDQGLKRMMTEFWLVDDQGLTSNDVEYLRCVADSPKGLSMLVSLLPYGKEEIETVVEPYLLQINAIRRTNRGREITEAGRRIIDGLPRQ